MGVGVCSEFDILFKKLHRILEVSPPKLPGKFYTMKRDHWFYEKRKADLTDWLNQVFKTPPPLPVALSLLTHME